MKPEFPLGFLIVLLLGGTPACFGQTPSSIVKSYGNVPLVEVLDDLADECGFQFSYDSDLIHQKQLKDFSLDGESCHLALAKTLQKAGLESSKVANGQFVLFPPKTGNQSSAPPISIRGIVLEESTGEALPGALIKVFMEGENSHFAGTISDENGNFDLRFPGTPEATVSVQYLGYRSKRLQLSSFEEANPLLISLSGNPLELESVVVTGKSDLQIGPGSLVASTSINPRKVDGLSVLGEPDVFRTLQFLPGISSTEESADGLFIRGGTPDQNLVLIDGIPIYNTGHFFGMFHAFNADALEKLDVSRGGFGVEHGGAGAGLVSIETKPTGVDSLEAGFSANLAALSAFVSVPLKQKKAAFMLAGRRSFNEVFQSPFYKKISGNVFQTGTIFENARNSEEENLEYALDPLSNFHDVHARFLMEAGKKGRFTASFYNGRDAVRYESDLIDPESDPEMEANSEENLTLVNTLAGLGYEVVLSDRFQLETKTHFSRYRGRFSNEFRTEDDQDTLTTRNEQDNFVLNLGLETGLNWNIRPGHHLKGGLDLNQIATGFEFISDDVEEELDSVSISSTVAALFLAYDYEPNSRWILSPGFRGSYYGVDEAWLLEPRMSVRYDLGNGIKINGNAGLYQQYLNPIQINNSLKLGMDFLSLASEDNDIEITQTLQTGLGVSLLRPGIWVDVQGYYKQLEGLERYVRSFDASSNAAEVEEQLTEGSGTSLGLDVLVRLQKGQFTGWTGYSLSQVIHYFEDLNEDNPFPGDQDHRHQVNLVASYEIQNWEFSATWTCASGKPYSTPVGIDSFIDVEGDRIFELRYTEINNFRLPAYHRLDANFAYRFPVARIARGKVGMSLFNLYNRANIRDRNYAIELADEDEDVPNIVRIDRDLLGFSPNVFFRLKF